MKAEQKRYDWFSEKPAAPHAETKPDIAVATWPTPLKPAAFTGIVGKLLDIITPHSEADPAALVVQLLTAIGNMIGRGPYFMAQGTRHHLNLFNALVGTTSRGRKGSSLDQILLPLRSVDEHWINRRIASGLSSGEGLIYKVRDPIEKQEPIKERGGHIKGYQTVIADPGESDKRLLVVEPEFARVLQVIERETNTLSPVIRQAWDSGNLQNLTKNSPLSATGAHISIIGHITRTELDRFLTETAVANGFANRFLWTCVRRSKLLPEGGALHRVDLAPVSRDLQEILDFARKAGEMEREDSLKDQWAEFYTRCAHGGTGLFDVATSRAEPQVMRIACLYALLALSCKVRQEDLDAGIATWTYCEDSARFLFGDKIGDATADQILVLLRASADGLTQSEVSDHFNRNKTAAELKRGLGVLQGLALVRSQEEETGGRKATRWFAV